MQETEDHRHEKKRSDGCEHETADYGPTERCILLAAFTETKSHWEHTDDHCRRRHDDWAQAAGPSFPRCFQRIHSFLEVGTREGYDKDRIRGGDTEAHDCTHHRRNA